MINGSGVYLFRSGDCARDSAVFYTDKRETDVTSTYEEDTYYAELGAERVYDEISAEDRRAEAWGRAANAQLVHQRGQLHTLALFFAPLKIRDAEVNDYVYDEPFATRHIDDQSIERAGGGSFGAAVKVPTFSENDVAVVKLLSSEFRDFRRQTQNFAYANLVPKPEWMERSDNADGLYSYFLYALQKKAGRSGESSVQDVWRMHRLFGENWTYMRGQSSSRTAKVIFFDNNLESALNEVGLAQFAMPGTFSVHNAHSVVRAAPMQPAATLVTAVEAPNLDNICQMLQSAEESTVSFIAGMLRLLKNNQQDLGSMLFADRRAGSSPSAIENALKAIARRVKEFILDPILPSSGGSRPITTMVKKYVNGSQKVLEVLGQSLKTYQKFTDASWVQRRYQELYATRDYGGDPGKDVLQEATFLYRCVYVPLCVAESAMLLRWRANPTWQNTVQNDLSSLFSGTGLMTGLVSLLFQGTFLVTAVADGNSLKSPSSRLELDTYQMYDAEEAQKPPRNTKRLLVAQMMASVHATSSAGVQHSDISLGNVLFTRLNRNVRRLARTRMAFVCREGTTSSAASRFALQLDVPSTFYTPQLSDFGIAKDLFKMQRNRVFQNTKLGTPPYQSPVYWMTLQQADGGALGMLRTLGMSAINDYWSMGWMILRELMPVRSHQTQNFRPSAILKGYHADPNVVSDTLKTVLGELRSQKPQFERARTQISSLMESDRSMNSQRGLLNDLVDELIVQWAVIAFNSSELKMFGGMELGPTQMAAVYNQRRPFQTGDGQSVVYGGGDVLRAINEFFESPVKKSLFDSLTGLVAAAHASLRSTFGEPFAEAVFHIFEIDPQTVTRYVDDEHKRLASFVHDHGTWIANSCLIPVLKSFEARDASAEDSDVPYQLQVSLFPPSSAFDPYLPVVPHELPISPFLQDYLGARVPLQRQTGAIDGDGALPNLLPVNDPAVSDERPYVDRDLTGARQRRGDQPPSRRRRTGSKHCAVGLRASTRSRRLLCARS